VVQAWDSVCRIPRARPLEYGQNAADMGIRCALPVFARDGIMGLSSMPDGPLTTWPREHAVGKWMLFSRDGNVPVANACSHFGLRCRRLHGFVKPELRILESTITAIREPKLQLKQQQKYIR